MSSLAAAPWFVLDLKETGSTVFPPGSNKCLPPIATIIMFFMGNSLEGDKGEGRGGGRDRKGTQSQMLLAGLQWDNLSGGQPGSLSALILCQGANPRGNTSGMLRVYEDTRLCQNGKNAQAIHVTRRPTHREHLCSAVPCNQKKTHSYGQGHATQQGLKKFHLCKKTCACVSKFKTKSSQGSRWGNSSPVCQERCWLGGDQTDFYSYSVYQISSEATPCTHD